MIVLIVAKERQLEVSLHVMMLPIDRGETYVVSLPFHGPQSFQLVLNPLLKNAARDRIVANKLGLSELSPALCASSLGEFLGIPRHSVFEIVPQIPLVHDQLHIVLFLSWSLLGLLNR